MQDVRNRQSKWTQAAHRAPTRKHPKRLPNRKPTSDPIAREVAVWGSDSDGFGDLVPAHAERVPPGSYRWQHRTELVESNIDIVEHSDRKNDRPMSAGHAVAQHSGDGTRSACRATTAARVTEGHAGWPALT